MQCLQATRAIVLVALGFKEYAFMLKFPWYFLCFLWIIIPACDLSPKKNVSSSIHHKVILAGSTSIEPIAEKLAEHYMEHHPGYKIEVQGGGSSAGIQAAKMGAADIGMSSRSLKKEEKIFWEHTIAFDAIVIIINPTNGIQNLTLSQIQKIFSSQITCWSDIDKSRSGKITVITREEGSGTRGAFEELIMHKTEISPRCLVQDSTGAVREIVASDPNAIGYVSFGGLNEQVKGVCIEGIPPKMQNMITSDLSQKYRIIRPFLFLTSKTPSLECIQFIEFIQSTEGQKILQEEGLIPSYEKIRKHD